MGSHAICQARVRVLCLLCVYVGVGCACWFFLCIGGWPSSMSLVAVGLAVGLLQFQLLACRHRCVEILLLVRCCFLCFCVCSCSS